MVTKSLNESVKQALAAPVPAGFVVVTEGYIRNGDVYYFPAKGEWAAVPLGYIGKPFYAFVRVARPAAPKSPSVYCHACGWHGTLEEADKGRIKMCPHCHKENELRIGQRPVTRGLYPYDVEVARRDFIVEPVAPTPAKPKVPEYDGWGAW